MANYRNSEFLISNHHYPNLREHQRLKFVEAGKSVLNLEEHCRWL
jgi:hypothetical protein